MKKKKVFGEGSRTSMMLGTMAIIFMMTLGIGVAQYQNAYLTRDIAESCGCNSILYDGEEDYCPIASGAQYVLDGIASGAFTFSELQAYVDAQSSGDDVKSKIQEVTSSIEVSQNQYSFDAGVVEQNDNVADISEIKISTSGGYDVIGRLLERLPQADRYCDEPPGIPDDWSFHPEALCMAAAMVPAVGATIANGAVSAFFSLFGPAAWATAMTQWLLILRGLGIADVQVLQLAATIYNTCMGLIG